MYQSMDYISAENKKGWQVGYKEVILHHSSIQAGSAPDTKGTSWHQTSHRQFVPQ
jgi:hypothetical protein